MDIFQGIQAITLTIVMFLIFRNILRGKEKRHELNKKIAASEKRLRAAIKQIEEIEF